MKLTSYSRTLACVLATTLLCPFAISQASSSEANIQVALKSMANNCAERQLNSGKAEDVVSVIQAATPNLATLAFVVAHYTPPAGRPLTLKALATQQTKTQVGAVPNSNGSTSLVQQPLAAQLLNLAVENGAVLDDVNGTTLTLSSSPYALIAAFAGDNDVTYANYNGYARLGFNSTFRIADSTAPLSSVNAQQLSNAGATFRFTPDNSARSTNALTLYNTQLAKLQGAAVASAGALRKYLADNDKSWKDARDLFFDDAQKAVTAALPGEAGKSQADMASDIEKLLAKVFDTDLATPVNADTLRPDTQVSSFLSAYPAYISALQDFQSALTALAKHPVGSIIYNYQQPANNSAYHEAGGTYAGSPRGWGGDVTVNALMSLYAQKNASANQGTFRGATGSVDLNVKIKRSPFVKDASDQSPVTIAFSGKYERLQENRHVAGKKADIGEGNVKLTIPLAGGLSFPISCTFANAGQTIKESFVRGNFGLTFDLDKLSALLKN